MSKAILCARLGSYVSSVIPLAQAGENAEPVSEQALASSPNGRFRIIVRSGTEEGNVWWLEDTPRSPVHYQVPVLALVADNGRHLIVASNGAGGASVAVYGVAGDVVLERSLDEMPVIVALEAAAGDAAAAQHNWAPLQGERPDLDRLLHVWLLRDPPLEWSAQLRFVADLVSIDSDGAEVSATSSRYGQTTLRLGDGNLVSDRRGSGGLARPATYPEVEGTQGPRP